MEIRSRTTFSGSLAVILFLLLVAGQFKATVSCGGSRNAYDKKAPRTPLMKKASIPDLPETSLQASGPAKGKITKNSPEFDKLKPCYNGDIIFKDEERTGEDRMMSKRCREKLTNLSDLVKAQWPKVKLVVTEAWDEQGSHSKNSLHYEGRAVDLRLSDRDKSKLGLLGRMAWEAGFDWVFYEDERHIHASVREDGYAEEAWDGCFSADSTVKLESGVDLQLRDLKIGDKIQVMSREGKIGFSEVMIFADYKPNVTKVPYILIETERPSKKLSLTSSHLIFTSNSTATKFKAKQAGSVVPGEIVLVSNGSELVSSLVRRVSLIERTGMIAPVTIQGNLIVDEVLSSCYAKIMDHDVAHMAFAPLRLAYTYAFNAWSTEGFIQQGMHWYPQILIEINRALSLYKLS